MQPETPLQLLDSVSHCIRQIGDGVEIVDEDALDTELMRGLVRAAVCSDATLASGASWLIWSTAQALGFGPADPAGLLAAIERQDAYSVKVPRFAVSREQFEGALAAFIACVNLEIGILTFCAEGCEPEDREPVLSVILAAGIASGWRYPILLTETLGGIDLGRLEAVGFDLKDFADETGPERMMEDLDQAGLSGTVAILRRHLIPWEEPKPMPPEMVSRCSSLPPRD